MKMAEEGFSSIEILIVVGAAFLIAASAATAGKKFLMEAVVEHETACLVSDLRWVQEHCRTAVYQSRKIPNAYPASADDYTVRIRGREYEVRGRGFKAFKGWKHVCPQSVLLVAPAREGGIGFDVNGAAQKMLTIQVLCTMGKDSAKRYIIIDAAGRIRVDRKPP